MLPVAVIVAAPVALVIAAAALRGRSRFTGLVMLGAAGGSVVSILLFGLVG